MIDPLSPTTGIGESRPGITSLGSKCRLDPAAGSASADFGAVLGRMITDTADVLRTAEATSIMGVEGTGVRAGGRRFVLAAEQTLQAAIAIRDKVVAAYLELSRMAI